MVPILQYPRFQNEKERLLLVILKMMEYNG